MKKHFPLQMLALLATFPGWAQGSLPVIRFSDLDSGPNVGGQGNAGAFVSVYGVHFGTTRGTSVVTVGGGAAAAYPIWTDTKITFQLGPSAATGNMVVTTSAGSSNGIPFTVRPGNIYFVATSGSDSNSGSFSAPWRTLLKARDTISAGDTVYGMDGVSQTTDDGQGWSTSMLLRRGGSPGAPMAMVAYPGAMVTIGSATGPTYGIRGVDNGTLPGYWIFAGLVLRGAASAMVTAGPSNYWRIVGNDISCPNGNGEVGCFGSQRSNYIYFYGNNVHDTGVATASAHYHAVYYSTDSNHLDTGWNTIANVHGCRGIQTYSSPLGSGGSTDPTGHNMYDISIHDNLIHDTQCDGIILATVDPSLGAVRVFNNIIYNAGKGPSNPENSGAWTCVNVPGTTANGSPGGGIVDVYNNTMYNCGSFANPPYANANAAVENGGNNTSLKIRIRNNIMYQVPPEPYFVIYGPADGIQGSNNLFFGNGAPPANPNITASLNIDPLFANLAIYDFHLSASSTAATGGTTTPQSWDFDSVPLPQGSAYPVGAYAYPRALGSPPPTVSVTVAPSSISLQQGQGQQFTATVGGTTNTAVTWSMSPAIGTLSTTGLYTAPASITTLQTVVVTATSTADITKSASGTVTLVPPVTVTVTVAPASISLAANQSQQFSATVGGTTNTAVTWSMSPAIGTLSTTGLYTAPASITALQTVVVTATSTADITKSASATVTLTPAVSVTVSPAAVNLAGNQSQQFTATVSGATNTSVTWSMNPAVGTLSSAGLYTAPTSITALQTVVVTATSAADATKSASATVTLTPAVSVTVSPAAVNLAGNQSQQFTATVTGTTNTSVTWSMNPAVGTLSATGLYTAPASITALQTAVVTATSMADATKSASATVTLTPSVSVSVAPASVSLTVNLTQQFTATVTGTTNTSVTWSMNPAIGTLSSTGLYTAPSSITTLQNVVVTATSTADSTKFASGTVTLTPPSSSGSAFSVTWTLLNNTQAQVFWTAPAGEQSKDYIALSGVGAPAWWYVWYGYTGGATSGSFVVSLPTAPGFYEFRYNLQGSYTTKAVSTAMPIATSGFHLIASTSIATAGSRMAVTWNVPAGRPSTDSVGLYRVGALNDQDIWHQYPNGATTGTFSVTAPTSPGTYEFRWRIGYLVAARSAPITVN